MATTPFLTALIRSRQIILDSTFSLFESASKPTGFSLPTLRLLDPAATLVIGPHQFHGTKLSVINRQFDGVQPNGSADASTSTHTSTAIIVEFEEAPTKKYILPDHFTCAVLSSSRNDRRQHLILSLFVFAKTNGIVANGIAGKGKGKANEAGVEDLEIPIPIDVVVEVENRVAQMIRDASRSSRPRDEALERWWLNTVRIFLSQRTSHSGTHAIVSQIASVPSRISTIKGVEPDPIQIEPLVMSPSTTREDSAGLEFSVAGPLAKAQRPSLLTSRSSSPIGMKEKKPINGKTNKRGKHSFRVVLFVRKCPHHSIILSKQSQGSQTSVPRQYHLHLHQNRSILRQKPYRRREDVVQGRNGL